MGRFKYWKTNPVTGEMQRDRTAERNANGGSGMRRAARRLREAREPPPPYPDNQGQAAMRAWIRKYGRPGR